MSTSEDALKNNDPVQIISWLIKFPFTECLKSRLWPNYQTVRFSVYPTCHELIHRSLKVSFSITLNKTCGTYSVGNKICTEWLPGSDWADNLTWNWPRMSCRRARRILWRRIAIWRWPWKYRCSKYNSVTWGALVLSYCTLGKNTDSSGLYLREAPLVFIRCGIPKEFACGTEKQKIKLQLAIFNFKLIQQKLRSYFRFTQSFLTHRGGAALGCKSFIAPPDHNRRLPLISPRAPPPPK